MDMTSADPVGTIIFSWCVPEEETGFTFIKSGMLLVKEENYKDYTFEVGTDDANVTQYSPKTQYQTATNSFSVNKKRKNCRKNRFRCKYNSRNGS